MYFFDTNILLKHLDKVKQLNKFYISSVTLEELEDIKSSGRKTEDVRYAARRAVRFLNENDNKFECVIYGVDIPEEENVNNDDKIIMCCCYVRTHESEPVTFVTDDMLCKLIAQRKFNIPVESWVNSGETIYKGYKEITGTSEQINDYLSHYNVDDWNINEYLIINNTDDGSTKEMRFDGASFVSLKLPPSKYIKGKNALQRCALDALMNFGIVAILGLFGSGKSYLCTKMGLYHVLEKGTCAKMVCVRETRGEGEQQGYLPGSLEEKIAPFNFPIAQQLDGGEWEMEKLKSSGQLEFQVPYYMKGTTYNETVMVVDEAEDLKEAQIRLIGTRIGQSAKVYFSGDFRQSVINKTTDNALIRMCNELKGDPDFACVCLEEDVRSSISKKFAYMFTKD